MNIKAVIIAACLAVATPAAAHEAITPNFKHAHPQHSRQITGRAGRRLWLGH